LLEQAQVTTAAAEGAPSSSYQAAIRAFAEVAGALTEARDSDTLLRLIGRHLCELVGISRCSVYLREPDSGLFRGRVGWNRFIDASVHAEHEARIKKLVAGTEADAFTREIVATQRPVVVTDTQSDARPVRSAMRMWGVRSMLGVPMVVRGEVIGIVFLDNADQPHRYTATESEIASAFADLAAITIAQAEMTTKLRRTLGTVARQNELLRRAAAMDEKLTQLVLAGGNLQQIAEAVGELTGKPCEIYDAQHRRLAGAVPAGLDRAGLPRGLDRELREQPPVREALAGLGDKGSGVIGPARAAGLTHRCLVAPITTRDDVWGSLVITEYGSRFETLDAHIARRAATNAALELSAERRAARAEWDARGSLAAELLRGTTDHGAIRRRGEYLGVELETPHVVCLVAAQGDAVLPDTARLATHFAERSEGREVLATAVAEGVVVILELDASLPALEAVRAARGVVEDVLADLSGEASLIAGVSSRCTALADYVGAYREACQVLSSLAAFADGGRAVAVTADELGPGRLFLSSASRAEAERFALDALGPLLAPADEGMRDLLHTLEVFFAHARSVRKSAQHLGVHENTIRYRLARVHEITGLAVGSDSDDELTAHLALRIVHLRQLASAPDTA
jgi:sugar diacid utilization regulator